MGLDFSKIQRISVVGTTGSGKSTFSKKLSLRMNLPYVELDALFWKPNWVESSPAEMEAKVTKVVSADRWIVDGGYSYLRSMIWVKADLIIWLDMPFPIILKRLIKRSFARALYQEPLWNGCYESFSRLFSRKSILLWALKSHPKRHEKFGLHLNPGSMYFDKFLRLQGQKQVDQFLADLP